jgi:tRNA-dihydrouridine synthase 1
MEVEWLDQLDFGFEEEEETSSTGKTRLERSALDFSPCERCLTGAELDAHVAAAHAWFESIGSPRLWVAPLVGYSDLSFRQLAREAGAHIASTQMLDAGGYCLSEGYRGFHDLERDSGPLVVQLGGSRPHQLRASAELLAAKATVAAVELNLGCPQRCARKTAYGAFLAEDSENLRACVSALCEGVRAGNAKRPPPTASRPWPRCATLCKIRCFSDTSKTISYAMLLQSLGADLVTVHGRTRQMGGGRHTGQNLANWAWIAAVKQALRVPVIANGNIRSAHDVAALRLATGCDGVMSGVGALRDPSRVFARLGTAGAELDSPAAPSAPVTSAELGTPAPVSRGSAEVDAPTSDAGTPAAAAAPGIPSGGAAPAQLQQRPRLRTQFRSRAHCAARYLEIAVELEQPPPHVFAHLVGKLSLVNTGGACIPAGHRVGRQLWRPNVLGQATAAFQSLRLLRDWRSDKAQAALASMREAFAAQLAAEEAHLAERRALGKGSDDEEDYDDDDDEADATAVTAGS